MASVAVNGNFTEQIKESIKKIRNCFKRSHEALQLRESNLLSRVAQIEKDYNSKTQELNSLVEALNTEIAQATENLSANRLAETHKQIHSIIDNKITELTAETDTSIEFEWDNQFDIAIEQIGRIKLIHGQTIISPTRTLPPQLNPVVPNYKAKQLPSAYFCKKSSNKKAPGELNCPRNIAVHYQTGNIYISDSDNHRIQVFSCNGDYLFLFSDKMNYPRGICISQNKVFVAQWSGHCINQYELRGKLIKSVGSLGGRETQFYHPYGLAVSDRNNNVYVCDYYNERVQILTQTLKFHSMLGKCLIIHPRDVKVTKDSVLVLGESDPCMFVFNLDHVLINRLITRGDDKQTNNPYCFDIDRDYNIIMSDYSNHCVYVFNQEGRQIHKFGKKGQGIGKFVNPYGIVLDNSGHIIVVCQKNTNCLQFF